MLNLVLTILAMGVIAVAYCNENEKDGGLANEGTTDTSGQVYTSQYYDQSERLEK